MVAARRISSATLSRPTARSDAVDLALRRLVNEALGAAQLSLSRGSGWDADPGELLPSVRVAS